MGWFFMLEINEHFPLVPGKPHQQIVIVALKGDATIDSSKIRRTVGRRIALGCSKFVIDIEGVSPITISTVQVLLAIVLDIRASRNSYVFVSTSGKLSEVLQRTRLEEQFPRYATQAEAIGAITCTA